MATRPLLILLSGSFWALAALYGPQPLLPRFAEEFQISVTDAASLITWSLVAMSMGPLLMGFLLQRFQSNRLITACLLLLSCSELLFWMTEQWDFLLVLRFFQGGLIAAMLAGTMTYLSGIANKLNRVMAYYVGSTIVGGLFGRLFAGYLASEFSWEAFFPIMGMCFLISGLASLTLPPEPVAPQVHNWRRLPGVLKHAFVRNRYVIVFCGFFVLTAALNFLPFRLKQLQPALDDKNISLFYLGFIAGFIVTLLAPQIAERMKGLMRTAMFAMIAVALGIALLAIPSIGMVFVGTTLLTCGFFLTHTSVATSLNKAQEMDRGAINSMYVSIYYIGGTAGSYVPGLVYMRSGWLFFCGLILAVCVLGVYFAFLSRS